jgi:hypothetical protein
MSAEATLPLGEGRGSALPEGQGASEGRGHTTLPLNGNGDKHA